MLICPGCHAKVDDPDSWMMCPHCGFVFEDDESQTTSPSMDALDPSGLNVDVSDLENEFPSSGALVYPSEMTAEDVGDHNPDSVEAPPQASNHDELFQQVRREIENAQKKAAEPIARLAVRSVTPVPPAPTRAPTPTPVPAPGRTPKPAPAPSSPAAPARAPTQASAPAARAQTPVPPRKLSVAGIDPRARKLAEAAENDRARGDFASAMNNLKLAVSFDPKSAELRNFLREVERQIPREKRQPSKVATPPKSRGST